MQTPHDGAPAGFQQTLVGEAVIRDFILPPAPNSIYSAPLAALRLGDNPRLRRIRAVFSASLSEVANR